MQQAYDVIVLGSGIAGLATAVAARKLGLRTLLLEVADRVGGGTCYSTGLVWVGCNHLAKAQGLQDDPASVMAYMRFLAGGQADERTMGALVETGPEALRFFEDCGVRLRLLASPDHYHGMHPHAIAGGRTMEAELFDGKQLGEWEPLLMRPAAGPGCVTAEELFRGRAQGYPEGLLAQRQGERMFGLGAGLVAHFLLAALRLGVELRLAQQTEELVRTEGVVTGLRLRDGTRLHARRGVVLATGGYESNPQMMAQFEGLPGLHSYFPESLRGDGLVLGARSGGAVSVIQNHLQLFLGFPMEDVTGAGRKAFQLAGIIELCSPHTLVVNRHGERFADESVFQLLAGRLREFDVHTHSHRNLPCFLLFDQDFVQGYSFAGRPPGDIPDWVSRAPDLAQLARTLGIAPEPLAATARRFNHFARTGADADFGRRGDPRFPGRPTLGPLEKPPFYGVQLHPACSSSAGLWVDANAQVCGYDGVPIPGLYAVGNAAAKRELGTGYQAGLTIASGMSFGLRAARHMAA